MLSLNFWITKAVNDRVYETMQQRHFATFTDACADAGHSIVAIDDDAEEETETGAFQIHDLSGIFILFGIGCVVALIFERTDESEDLWRAHVKAAGIGEYGIEMLSTSMRKKRKMSILARSGGEEVIVGEGGEGEGEGKGEGTEKKVEGRELNLKSNGEESNL